MRQQTQRLAHLLSLWAVTLFTALPMYGGHSPTTPRAQNDDDCFAFVVADGAGLPGDTVCISISAEQFTNIIGLQFSFVFDTAALQYVGIQNFGVPTMDLSHIGPPNDFFATSVRVSWFNQSLMGIDLPDGTVLFDACFVVRGQPGSQSALQVTNSPSDIEIITGAQTLLPYTLLNGTFTVAEGVSTLRADAFCVANGSCEEGGSVAVAVSGGQAPYSYAWAGSNGFSATTQNVAGLAGGTYQMTVTDSQGQSATITAVTMPGAIAFSSVSPDTSICAGSATTLGFTAADVASVSWSPAAGLSCTDCPAPIAAPAATTTYTVTAVNSAGCSASTSVTISVESISGPLLSGALVGCSGTDLALSGAAGFAAYSWQRAGITLATTQDFALSGLSAEQAGTYTLQVTSASGCMAQEAFEVTVTPAPTVSVNAVEPTCQGIQDGLINLSAPNLGQLTFQWSDAPDLPSTPSRLNLGAGQYIVLITDSNGCAAAQGITLHEASPIMGEFIVNGEVCGTQPITLSIGNVDGGLGGPFFYSVDGGTTQLPIPDGPILITPDWQGLIISEAAGCRLVVDTISIQSSAPLMLLVATVAPSNCPDANTGSISVQGLGGTPPYSYFWSNGANTSGTPLQQLGAGVYNVTVVDQNNCSVTSQDITVGSAFPVCAYSDTMTVVLGTPNEWCLNSFLQGDYVISGVGCISPQGALTFNISPDGACVSYTLESGFATNMCVQICTPDQSHCITADLYISAATAAVWPGDTDNNGMANQYDLLPIGIAFQAEGPTRINASADWSAQTARLWPLSTPATGIRYHYIDSNGDGLVGNLDAEVLGTNFGEEHDFSGIAIAPELLSPASDNAPAIFVDPVSPLLLDEVNELPLMLGTASEPFTAPVYGIAFQLEVQAPLTSLTLEPLLPSWLGSDLLYLVQPLSDTTLAVAISRKDQTSVLGGGQIATLRFQLEPLVSKGNPIVPPVHFVISGVRLIGAQEDILEVQPLETSVAVPLSTSAPAWLRLVSVWPNPNTGDTRVDAQGLAIRAVRVVDSYGRLLLQEAGNGRDHLRLDLASLPSGAYRLAIVTDEGVGYKTIVKQ